MDPADCDICRQIPEAVSVLMLSQELPAASRLLVPLAQHFARCPSCGAYYFQDWDDFPFCSGASDEERLFRLHPAQAELLGPLLGPLLDAQPPDGLNRFAFYLGEVGYQLAYPALYGREQPVVLSLLYVLSGVVQDDADVTLHALVRQSLERFVDESAARARLVLEVVGRFGDAEGPRVGIKRAAPEVAELLDRCVAIAAGATAGPPL